jgi:uncharacterized protein (DUF2252 family)
MEQVARFASGQQTGEFALTLTNTQGALLNVIRAARVNSRWQLLEANTTINDFDRRFSLNQDTRPVDAGTRQKVMDAFQQYLQTIPSSKRFAQVNYNVKDIVARRGVGIGSAGLPSYNLLVEGPTQALENDILIYMKQAQVAAPSRVVTDPKIGGYFEHNGHRTVLSQRALQAYADPWLGYTAIDGVGQLVAEVSPYTADLEWDDINDIDDIIQVLGYLGQAVAKIHCVSDVDSDQTLVPFSTDQAIHAALQGKEDAFVQAMIDFGQSYGDVVRDDYRLFIDAFRNHEISGV